MQAHVETGKKRPFCESDETRESNPMPSWAIWAAYMAHASIFGTAFVVFERPVAIHMSFILAALSIGWMLLMQQDRVRTWMMIVGGALLVHGSVGLFFDTTSLRLMSKVLASSVLFYGAFAMLVDVFRHRLKDLVQIYLVCCLVVAVIGLFQGVSFLVGFQPGYDYSYFLGDLWNMAPGGPIGIKLNSILVEPSQVAFTMGPAIVLSFYRIFNIGPQFLTLPAALAIFSFALLSASSSVHVALIIALVCMVRISPKKFLMLGLAGLPLFFMMMNSVYLEASILKFEGLLELFKNGVIGDRADATTYSLYVHFKVALENFVQTWGLGGGLGSHEYVFPRYASADAGPFNIWSISTAGNLTFRLISELGVFGLAIMAFYFYISIQGILRLSAKNATLHAALVAGIGVFFVRNGTYAHFGLAFYVILLLMNYSDGSRQTEPGNELER